MISHLTIGHVVVVLPSHTVVDLVGAQVGMVVVMAEKQTEDMMVTMVVMLLMREVMEVVLQVSMVAMVDMGTGLGLVGP